MGTILYVILRLCKVIDFPNDVIIICFLLSLDSISLVLHLSLKKVLRTLKG